MSATKNAGGPATVPFRGTPQRQGIQYVLFDMCGVLYDDSEWKRWLLSLVTRMGLHTHYTPFFRLWEREYQRDVWSGRRDFWLAYREFLLAAGLSRPQIDEVIPATRAKLRAYDDRIRPFGGVREALRELTRAGIKLIVVSRTPQTPGEIEHRLQRLGFGGLPIRVIATSDVRFVDDAQLFFQRLGNIEGIAPATAAYLGRDTEDLLAAANAGLLTIAFNHDPDAVAHLYLEQFDQLLNAVQRHRAELLAAG